MHGQAVVALREQWFVAMVHTVNAFHPVWMMPLFYVLLYELPKTFGLEFVVINNPRQSCSDALSHEASEGPTSSKPGWKCNYCG